MKSAVCRQSLLGLWSRNLFLLRPYKTWHVGVVKKKKLPCRVLYNRKTPCKDREVATETTWCHTGMQSCGIVCTIALSSSRSSQSYGFLSHQSLIAFHQKMEQVPVVWYVSLIRKNGKKIKIVGDGALLVCSGLVRLLHTRNFIKPIFFSSCECGNSFSPKAMDDQLNYFKFDLERTHDFLEAHIYHPTCLYTSKSIPEIFDICVRI